MLWNRWTRARQFQQRDGPNNMCVLGCGGASEDSIEHYGHCDSVRTVAARFLRLGSPEQFGSRQFLILDNLVLDESTLVCRLLLVYAAFMATNNFRGRGGATAECATDALEHFCKNACQGHAPSSQFLDARWVCSEEGEGVRADKRLRRRSLALFLFPAELVVFFSPSLPFPSLSRSPRPRRLFVSLRVF